jgi:hypothetical protein
MFSALFSFLGGSVFRMIWGEVSSYFNKKQDHEYEMQRLTLESELDAKRHERDMYRLKMQADLNVREVQVMADAAVSKTEADAWLDAVQSVGKQTGYKVIDIWNGAIRPLLATLSIGVVVVEIIAHGFVLSDWDRELVAAILGIYVADRTLQKRGK